MKHFLSSVLVLPALVASTTCSEGPTAVLDSGPIVGVETSLPGAIAPVHKYLGIPYAEPPERFEVTKKPKRWNKPLNTTEFGPACTQFVICGGAVPSCDVQNDLFNGDPPPESEDCLYMNAFAPTTPVPKSGRPVVLFIHGGGFQLSHGRIDLAGFAAYEDIVAFSFNYRTNIFGFPNSPDLDVQERNLGFHDQQRAIEWVQANAAAFGGDPDKVTIWGESAGAISTDVKLHVYAESDPPPFRGAIMMSGQMSYGWFASASNAQDPRTWNGVADVVGCSKNDTDDQLDCMRQVPAKGLIKALVTTGTGFLPVIDNKTLPDNRAAALRSGNVAKVPIMVTSIAEEGRGLVGQELKRERFEKAYLPEGIVTQEQKDLIFSHYKSRPELKNEFEVLTAIYTDFVLQCPAKLLTDDSASLNNPTWRGYFNESITNLFPKRLQFIGKFHGSDVLLLFADPVYERVKGLTAEQVTFANYYRSAIARFIKNPQGGPGWPAAGGRYDPLDIVTLGDVGSTHTSGATPVNKTQLDAACAMYKDIYPVIEKYAL